MVTLREERVSRNSVACGNVTAVPVTLREERVSRNFLHAGSHHLLLRHAPRGACE